METRPYNLTGWKKYLFLIIHLFAVRRGRRTLQNRCQFHEIFRADEGICPYKLYKFLWFIIMAMSQQTVDK